MTGEERSQFGHYPLRQSPEEFSGNVKRLKIDMQNLYLQIAAKITPEERAKLTELMQRSGDLAERLCIEKDDEVREGMRRFYKELSESETHQAVGALWINFPGQKQDE